MKGLLALLVLPVLVWAVLTALRIRRTRYLMAHRSKLIKESLERARRKQGQIDTDIGLAEDDEGPPSPPP